MKMGLQSMKLAQENRMGMNKQCLKLEKSVWTMFLAFEDRKNVPIVFCMGVHLFWRLICTSIFAGLLFSVPFFVLFNWHVYLVCLWPSSPHFLHLIGPLSFAYPLCGACLRFTTNLKTSFHPHIPLPSNILFAKGPLTTDSKSTWGHCDRSLKG